MISVHLKSKLLTFPGGRFNPRDEDERARYAVYALHRRAAEAAGIRSYVTGLLDGQGQQRPVVVAGDLNDEAQAATTQILLGPPGSEIGTPGYDQPDAGDGARLWNLAALIPEPERYSRIYRGRRELIDHLLVSHALRDSVTAVTTGQIELPSITDNPQCPTQPPGLRPPARDRHPHALDIRTVPPPSPDKPGEPGTGSSTAGRSGPASGRARLAP